MSSDGLTQTLCCMLMSDGGSGEANVACQYSVRVVLQIVSKLHTILKPFLLRRIKSDVENSLPAKKEIILYAHMTEHQKSLDAKLRERTLNVRLAQLVHGSASMGLRLFSESLGFRLLYANEVSISFIFS